MTTLYQAADGFVKELKDELQFLGTKIRAEKEHLLWCEGDAQPVAWAQDTWKDIQEVPVSSIGEGVKALRGIAKDWALVSAENHRRASLILANLSTPKEKKIIFPEKIVSKKFASFTLWEKELALVSTSTVYPLPRGEMHFEENKIDPPSRAYLKLWEALTLIGDWPKAGDRCVDMGSSPGSWTWALAELGADVLSIDRSPLAEQVMTRKNVKLQQGNAFSVKPQDIGAVDWFFSDVICYPEKLLEMIELWLASGLCQKFICTIKFQGPVDPKIVEKFKQIPGSKVLHLFHNKHELTWVKL